MAVTNNEINPRVKICRLVEKFGATPVKLPLMLALAPNTANELDFFLLTVTKCVFVLVEVRGTNAVV